VEQAEKKHGGYRPGAVRKSKYGVKTIVMRVPENRVQSVTEYKAEPIEDIRLITSAKDLS
jgi:hypothetical protein